MDFWLLCERDWQFDGVALFVHEGVCEELLPMLGNEVHEKVMDKSDQLNSIADEWKVARVLGGQTDHFGFDITLITVQGVVKVNIKQGFVVFLDGEDVNAIGDSHGLVNTANAGDCVVLRLVHDFLSLRGW